MTNKIYKHIGYFCSTSDLKALSGKSADDIVLYWKKEFGRFSVADSPGEPKETQYIQTSLAIGESKLSSDGKYLTVDQTVTDPDFRRYNSVAFIDIYELESESAPSRTHIAEMIFNYRAMKGKLASALAFSIRTKLDKLKLSRLVLDNNIFESRDLDTDDKVYHNIYVEDYDYYTISEFETVSVENDVLCFGFYGDGVHEKLRHWELSIDQLDGIDCILEKAMEGLDDGNFELTGDTLSLTKES